MNYLKLIVYLMDYAIKKKARAMSFDVTNKCNLKCSHCYWYTQGYRKELPIEDIIILFKNLRKEGILHCTYVGGEPTLRPDVLIECTKIMPYNFVVTNGTTNPPELKNAYFNVSIDGTEKIHDEIRGYKGLYKRIFDNYSERKRVYTVTSIMRANRNEPTKLLKEWSNTEVDGMFFNFTTPFRGMDNSFWLSWKEREEVIKELIKLKKEYGPFLILTEKQLDLLRKENVQKWSKNCTIKWFAKSFYSDGSLKKPCVMGERAICNKCGCHVSTLVDALFYRFDFEVFKLFKKLLS